MTDRLPRSKHDAAGTTGTDDPLRAEPTPEFDPYKFSKVTVPLELRRQMVEARLPRLEAEFFHDTLPPSLRGTPNDPSPESPRPESLEELPPRRRPIKLVVACVLGAVVLLTLGLLKTEFRTTQWGKAESAARPPVRPSSHVTLEAAMTASTAPPASTASTARNGERASTAASTTPAIAASAERHARLPDNESAPRTVTARHSTQAPRALGNPGAAPVAPETPAEPRSAASATVQPAASPSVPVVPKPIQTSWLSPK